jgi:hypothetical protein
VSLHLSRDGKIAAMANTRGRHGVVVEIESGRATLILDRGDYHNEDCDFPLAFCRIDDRPLLIHGTVWNRLDVSDPLTGALLTDRSPTSYRYADYFHCGLAVSPSHQYVADDGWVWHPAGSVVTWNLQRWVHEYPWESDKGSSRRDLCSRCYYWGGPLCWISDERLAVWGYGEDVDWLIPAARIFNVVTGAEDRWFAGPKGDFHFDQFLFSADAEVGTAVWDVDTGERLLLEQSFCPGRYHPGMKAFLTLLPGGAFQISRLNGAELTPAGLTRSTDTVRRLAEAIREGKQFGDLPVLADALEEAGCTDLGALEHCRQPGPHGNTCWVVDRILQENAQGEELPGG